ncbi:MAG: hypothetical protein ACLR4Z_01580 [Butyricicoccaceae bacterium]
MGADRVAAAVAAKARGSLPCVVVDCWTRDNLHRAR